MARARQDADLLFRRVGITFNVYGDEAGAERLIPFRFNPADPARIGVATLGGRTASEGGRSQCFLQDVYHDRRIIEAGVIPADLIYQNPQYRPELTGVHMPHNVWAHISGVDIVRAGQGEFMCWRTTCVCRRGSPT